MDPNKKKLHPDLKPSLLQNFRDISGNDLVGTNLHLGISRKSAFQREQERLNERKKLESEEYSEVLKSFENDFIQEKRPIRFLTGETMVNSQVIDQGKEKTPYLMELPKSTGAGLLQDPPPFKRKKGIDQLKDEFKEKHAGEKKRKNEAEDEDFHEPKTSNFFISNLALNVSEQRIWDLFGKFGGIEFVNLFKDKESEEEKPSSKCFEIKFVDEENAISAKSEMEGYEIFGKEIKMSWKEPSKKEKNSLLGNYRPSDQDIKIQFPSDLDIWTLIDRCAENVVKHGMEFEFCLKKRMRQENDPRFSTFLFDDSHPDYYYYRWKIYSLLEGDKIEVWRTFPFQMIQNGLVWIPPEIPLIDPRKKEERIELASYQKNSLLLLLSNLTLQRQSIRDGLEFCFDNRESYFDIVEIISNSFLEKNASPTLKLARAYLVSDILWNSQLRLNHASSFRSAFESKIPIITESLRDSWLSIEGRMSSISFKESVLKLLRIWESWSLYNPTFFQGLLSLFTTGVSTIEPEESHPDSENPEKLSNLSDITTNDSSDEDIDGIPLEESEILTLDLDSLSQNEIERVSKAHGIAITKVDDRENLLRKLKILRDALK